MTLEKSSDFPGYDNRQYMTDTYTSNSMLHVSLWFPNAVLTNVYTEALSPSRLLTATHGDSHRPQQAEVPASLS